MSFFIAVLGTAVIFWLWKRGKADRREVQREPKQRPIRVLEERASLSGLDQQAPSELRPMPTRNQTQVERVAESVAVVLCRQVPPHDGPPRSWLGGLPMLPAGLDWPCGVNPEKQSEGNVPLHFVAQIACADLPTELWGGLGPRSGWLRLFYNGNSCESGDRGLWRLVHSEELGEERTPPANIGVIHDGVYTGGSAWTQSQTAYPRWPVDLRVVGNTLRHEGQRSWPTPDDFETVMYPGAEVQRDRHKLPQLLPFSRRVLREGLRSLVKSLTSSKLQAQAVSDDLRVRFADPANFELVKSVPAQHVAQSENRQAKREAERLGLETLGESERAAFLNASPYIQHARQILAKHQALLANYPTPESLIANVEDGQQAFVAWRDASVAKLEQWAASLEKSDLDIALHPSDQDQMKVVLDLPAYRRWVIRSEGGVLDLPRHIGLAEIQFSLGELARNAWSEAARDIMATYYLDPALRGLLPVEHLPAFEAFWRALYSNRPHRIGGYHDGVQSDAVEGPQDRLLLLQLATDDAMQFCWGDAGAIYVWIRPADLKANRFDAAEFWLECH